MLTGGPDSQEGAPSMLSGYHGAVSTGRPIDGQTSPNPAKLEGLTVWRGLPVDSRQLPDGSLARGGLAI